MTDKKRLTANQVAESCLNMAAALCDHEGPQDVHALGYVEAMQDAARLMVANLIPRWQDEPDADGLAHWVEGLSDRMPVILYRSDDGRWLLSGSIPDPISGEWVDVDGEQLNNRRVCPIGERPEAGE